MKFLLACSVCLFFYTNAMELTISNPSASEQQDSSSLDGQVYQYILKNPHTRLSIIWPRAANKVEGIKKILAQAGQLLYEKKFVLFRKGPTHLFLVAHPGWSEDVALSMCHYIPADMQQPYQFTAVLFETTKDLEEIKHIKQQIRDYAGISYWSIHIDDNHAETCTLARSIFKKNADKLFRKLTRTVFEWWQRKKVDKIKKTLKKYAEMGGDLEKRDEKDRTILFIYARRLPELLPSVIEEGAHVDTHCLRQKRTPLWIAASHNNLEAVRVLLAHGAQVNGYDETTTPLAIAAMKARLAIVKILIRAEASQHDFFYNSLLFHILSFGCDEHKSIVEELFAGGALIEQRDELGNTALMIAASGSCLSVFELILQKTTNIDAENHRGETALLKAVLGWKNTDEKVRLLLEAGANPNKGPENSAPLIQACKCSYAKSKMLMDAGAAIMWERGNYTPLTWAAANSQITIVRELLKRHPHTFPKNYVYIALMIRLNFLSKCNDEKCAQMVQELIGAGALRTSAPDEEESFNQLISQVASRGCLKTLEVLLSAKLPLNSLNEEGLTPLMQLIWSRIADLHFAHNEHRSTGNELEAIKMLVAAGAGKTIKDPLGRTAFDIAKEFHLDFADVLNMLT